ncbi:hypothetical protein ACEQ8H_003562 [Pleosporales sp. CAS-2024a]
MLTEGRIDSLDAHLEQFKLNNRTAQLDLSNLLKEFGQLLNDYKDLKKAYDAKFAKAATKNTAAPTRPAGQPHSPYVLMLVDGDGYIFNDEFIRDREEGGMRAARVLNEAVEKYLHRDVPGARASRIVVRIYADLTHLSKQLAKSNLTGFEKRSVGAFSAAFTRAISSFDFIDALDEEGTKFKIREQFRVASEDSACSHILGLRDKITLVQAAGWNPDFHQFNLNVTQFPTVFRWLELPTTAPNAKVASPSGPGSLKSKLAQRASLTLETLPGPRQMDSWRNSPGSAKSSVLGGDRASSRAPSSFDSVMRSEVAAEVAPITAPQTPRETTKQPCKFHQKGFCRLGDECGFQHASSPSVKSTRKPSSPAPSRQNPSASLPATVILPGYIPLNKDDQRIDTYIRPPTPQEFAIYNARFHKRKPCNNFHLQGTCKAINCPYDHQELEPTIRHVLEYVVKCSPCPRRSKCRAAKCFHGHLCQKDGCRGHMRGCKMKADLHAIDPKLANMVVADEEEQDDDLGQAQEGALLQEDEGEDEGDDEGDENGYEDGDAEGDGEGDEEEGELEEGEVVEEKEEEDKDEDEDKGGREGYKAPDRVQTWGAPPPPPTNDNGYLW